MTNDEQQRSQLPDADHIGRRAEYPRGVPRKFAPSGEVQHFPGNTIVCHLSHSSELYSSLLALYEKLERSPLSSLFTLLPPASWHMTVFDAVCDKRPKRLGYWPADMALDASLEECTANFGRKLSAFDLRCDPPYRVSTAGFGSFEVGILVTLRMRGAAEESRLRGLRDRLADVLMVRHADHATYQWHLSMAYLLRHLTEDQDRELRQLLEGHFVDGPVDFELGAPEFCTFEDMFEFKREFYLKNQVES